MKKSTALYLAAIGCAISTALSAQVITQRDLMNAENARVMQSITSGTGGSPLAPSAPVAPVAEANRPTHEAIAIYGVVPSGGASKSAPAELRGYVNWEGHVYPVYPGAVVRGRKVVRIAADGVYLQAGRGTQFVPMVGAEPSGMNSVPSQATPTVSAPLAAPFTR